MERVKPKTPVNGGGNLFLAAPKNVRFIPSGCTILDLVLGGGWPLGRMSNVIGDKSTGKTLLAIEACSNFAKLYPKGRIWYREAEAAFDPGYAEALGMPLSRVHFGDNKLDTIEDMFEDLSARLSRCKNEGLYILDSLDALSDRDEMDRPMGEGSYNLGKQKKLGELFRKRVREIDDHEVALLIISQVRAKIGAMFGEKTTRSGGAALDFYATIHLKLSHLKEVVATIRGVKRVTGIRIKAKCTKNKIGLAQRSCEFVLRFGYGVDNFQASLEWLAEVGRLKDAGIKKDAVKELLIESDEWDAKEHAARTAELDKVVIRVWNEIETDFLPVRRKYG